MLKMSSSVRCSIQRDFFAKIAHQNCGNSNTSLPSSSASSFAKKKAPRGFWDDVNNQRKYFDWVAEQLGFAGSQQQQQQHEEEAEAAEAADFWYTLKTSDIVKLGGSGLLDRHGNSLFRALSTAYPEVRWQPWRFSQVPKGFWKDLGNQRQYFDWVGEKLGIRSVPEDWYNVSTDQIDKLGAYSKVIVNQYQGSLFRALSTVYSEHEWHSWRFNNYFAQHTTTITTTMHNNSNTTNTNPNINNINNNDQTETVRQYVDFLAKSFAIQRLDDWYRISPAQISKLGRGYGIITRNGGLCSVLTKLYPEHHWDPKRFVIGRLKKSWQRWLKMKLRELFPTAEILEDYLHPDLLFGESGEKMQLDVYVPSLSLAFEYHGSQHYHDIYFLSPQSTYLGRDNDKAATCASAGITLVIVPYWWDRTTSSLAATIRAVRPALIPADAYPEAEPIPGQPQSCSSSSSNSTSW